MFVTDHPYDSSKTSQGGSLGDSKNPLSVESQSTPNPNAKKFILNRDVKITGKVSFTDLSSCEHVPLASSLLRLANVTQVHFFENVLTVTQNGASDWPSLEKIITAVIKELISQHDPDFEDKLPKSAKRSLGEINPEVALIEEVLDRTIRPGLQADGGDVEVIELDGNILTVQYQGACGGCPSSMMGTLQAIESILRTEFNPYLEVVAI
jgi:Fe-S cluster biogenesis protein NfuA